MKVITNLDYNVDWSKYFYYDELSRSCLKYKNSNGYKGTAGVIANADAGSIVGGNSSKNYWRVRFNNKTYSVHRIIWVLKFGYLSPDLTLNHIDCDSLNNKISNLEVCSNIENCRRQKKHLNIELLPTNSSGYNGIHYQTNKDGTVLVVVQWVDSTGKRRKKAFSTKRLGSDSLRIALLFQKDMIEKANNEGAKYNTNYLIKE